MTNNIKLLNEAYENIRVTEAKPIRRFSDPRKRKNPPKMAQKGSEAKFDRLADEIYRLSEAGVSDTMIMHEVKEILGWNYGDTDNDMADHDSYDNEVGGPNDYAYGM